MIYLELFWSFLQVGLFSFGGGYAALSLIQSQIVDIHKWLPMTEYVDLITIAGMAPGSIAINSATFVGNRVAGLGGSIVATIACVLPSFLIVLTLAFFYYKYKNLAYAQGVLNGIRPVVVALIASAGASILSLAFWGGRGIFLPNTNYIAVGLFAACLAVLRKYKPNPIFVIAGSGVVGMVIYLLI